MKKTYQKPAIYSFAIETKHKLMTGSITENGDNLQITVGGEDMTSGTINSRSTSVWGDDEED